MKSNFVAFCFAAGVLLAAEIPASASSALSEETKRAVKADLVARGYGHIFDVPGANEDDIFARVLTPSSVTLSDSKTGKTTHVAELPKSNLEGIDPSQIIQIGKAAWQIIEDNAPVVNYTSDFTGAVPQGITDWTKMEGWKDYKSPEYDIKFVNFLNMRLTEFKWVWSFKYGGSYNGTGNYITTAGAAVNNVYAYLTEHVDVDATAFSPVNYGTVANPIGGVDLQIKMTSYGKFKKTIVGCHITIHGDGTFKEVTCDKGTHHC